MTAPFLIIGASGQVGRALKKNLSDTAVNIGRDGLDLNDTAGVNAKTTALIEHHQPKAVIIAAAYTAVDKAESDEQAAYAVNATSVGQIADATFEAGLPLVHYSTDYVFEGSGERPWRESDATGPLGVYGKSKLAGEEAIMRAAAAHKHAKWLIFRTSWVYDEDGKNFLNTMLRLGAERETLSVVADQHGAPTYAADIADATVKALEAAMAQAVFPYGIYHLCNSGSTTWHGFAEAIFAGAKKYGRIFTLKELCAIETSKYPTPAKRPANSRMDTSRLTEVLGVKLAPWQDALSRCLAAKFSTSQDHAA